MLVTPATKIFISVFLIWLFHFSAIIGMYLGYSEWFLPFTPLNLGICFLLILWNTEHLDSKDFLILSIPFSLGMTAELLGVNFGLIFGEYSYGENLGWKIGGVPVIIGINWVILTYVTGTIGKRLHKNIYVSSLTSTSLMLGLDVLLEKLAPTFDFWEFEGGEAPLQNFIGWFFIAFIAQFLFQKQFTKGNLILALHIFIVFLLFFGIFVLFPFF